MAITDPICMAEKNLVGALILSQKKIVEVIETVRAEDFLSVDAKSAFSIIVSIWTGKQPVDLVSVAVRDRSLAAYLAEATTETFYPSVMQFALDIREAAKKRRIVAEAKKIVSGGLSSTDMMEKMITTYQRELGAVKKDASISEVMRRMDNHIAQNRASGAMILSTGFEFLDNSYITYVPGHIWTIGGYTSTGKSAVMIQKICNLIATGRDVPMVVISTEMTEEQIAARILSNFTGIHSYNILSGNIRTPEDAELIADAKTRLSSVNLKIYDSINTLADIETAFRQADIQGGVRVGFIDYVQNIRVPGAKSQYQEQSDIAKRFQKLAKDLRATLVCLSQVSNSVGRGYTDNLELKGAGEWAAVSDIGIMLTRNKTDKYQLKYDVKKNRHGRLCDRILEYRWEYTRLEEVR